MNKGNWCSAVLLFSHLFLPIISTLAFPLQHQRNAKGDTISLWLFEQKFEHIKKPYIKMIPNRWLPSTNTIYLIIYNGMQEMPVSFLFNGPFTARSQKAPQRCCNNCDSNHQNAFLESQSRRDSGCPHTTTFWIPWQPGSIWIPAQQVSLRLSEMIIPGCWPCDHPRMLTCLVSQPLTSCWFDPTQLLVIILNRIKRPWISFSY